MICIATFYTHASALLSHRALKNAGIEAKMAPVPRSLSSSCGTCVSYRSDDPHFDLLDADVEAVYEASDDGYRRLLYHE